MVSSTVIRDDGTVIVIGMALTLAARLDVCKPSGADLCARRATHKKEHADERARDGAVSVGE
eukprot:3928313-Prymnesium_polylepis.1